MITWFGKHGILTWNETVDKLYHHSNENITFFLGDQQIQENITEKLIIPIGLCKVYEGKPDGQMKIEFKDRESEYIVYISDPSAANYFQLPFSLIHGEMIKAEFHKTKKKFKSCSIRLKETNIKTGTGCLNYPTAEFNTYSDCFDSLLKEFFLPKFGCVAPWMSRTEQCNSPVPKIKENEEAMNITRNLFDFSFGGKEFRADKCPLPCSLVATTSRYAFYAFGYDVNSIFIQFENDINVENIDLAYDSLLCFTDVGGCLGIWLGTHTYYCSEPSFSLYKLIINYLSRIVAAG